MKNREARIMMKVPARAIGDISYYKMTNTRRFCFVGEVSGVEKYRMNQKQNKQSIFALRARMEHLK